MTADLILAHYRTAFTAETADIDAQIVAKEDEASRVNGELRALLNRREAMETKHNAALYVALHVKVDPLTGEAVARQGKPTKAAVAARATEPPDPPPADPAPKGEAKAPPESLTGDPKADTALADAADAFMATISDDRTPAQVRLVLADLDWAVDEMNQYSDTALAYAARHRIGPQSVTLVDGGMQIDATGEVIP